MLYAKHGRVVVGGYLFEGQWERVIVKGGKKEKDEE